MCKFIMEMLGGEKTALLLINGPFHWLTAIHKGHNVFDCLPTLSPILIHPSPVEV